eukprot:CAMPEP_0198206694 /NCGR_PEP_ID=MMETSP1445-20131203/10226_1 /TAXON_ID=36898 /ORGANISM="Pyramimonas sp., Strain CCMP2087" /LENGTH=242 /DNA_ID=CAMNT_0043879475 /DNA_START=238 /DNA_END=966 /DNA_ORIENTATION=-
MASPIKGLLNTSDPSARGAYDGTAAEVDRDAYHSRWESMWAPGLVAGQAFDAGASSGALLHALETGLVDVRDKTCFVPGCGRGYDVASMAKKGASAAIGLEISTTAARDANTYLAGCDGVDSDKAKVVEGDFFKFADTFDVGYDYTFFCALHPTMRADWAVTWGRLIKPGGMLVTLIFPVDPPRDDGPPFCVHPDNYTAVLPPNGFENIYLEKVPEDISHPKRAGREFLGIWRRKLDPAAAL